MQYKDNSLQTARWLQPSIKKGCEKAITTRLPIKKRLAFCKKYQNWTEQQWQEVLFSDESTFSQFGSSVIRVRRQPNTRYHPRNTIATVKHSPKVMVWGCFTAAGRGTLVFVPVGKTVNAEFYSNMLKDKLQRTMTLLNCIVFQQDSAPCHTAKSVKKWMQSEYVKLLGTTVS